MKLDKYLKAAQELQTKALGLVRVEKCAITVYHFKKSDGTPPKSNRPTVILELEEIGEEHTTENFSDRYFAFYPFWTKAENDEILARATEKLARIAGAE